MALLQWVVMDEADALLEVGEVKRMSSLIKMVPLECKFIFASATLTKKLQAFLEAFFEKKLKILVSSENRLENLEHIFLPIKG